MNDSRWCQRWCSGPRPERWLRATPALSEHHAGARRPTQLPSAQECRHGPAAMQAHPSRGLPSAQRTPIGMQECAIDALRCKDLMQVRGKHAEARAHDALVTCHSPLAPPFFHSFSPMHSTYVKPEAQGEERIRLTTHPWGRAEWSQVDE